MKKSHLEKFLPWFYLKSVPGIGNHLFKRLIDRFQSPERVLKAPEKSLMQIDGVSERLARAIRTHSLSDDIKRELCLLSQKNYRIVTLQDLHYPPLLKHIPDPPPYLYVYGRLDNLTHGIAVVGSRHATDYGITTTKRLCADLATRGIVIISGMARGIDTAAHRGALAGKGKTVAVLGSGLEKIYPEENRNLFHEIAKNGAVISELPLETDPEAYHFPARNRIISGMSLGVVVIEATNRSGSLITARLAAEQNREVFAVPGSIHSFKSTGTHSLIKQGAKLVEHAKDILEEFSHIIDKPAGRSAPDDPFLKNSHPPLSPEETDVLQVIGVYPVHIDDIVRKTAMGAGKLSGILLNLELKGMVRQSPGKFFSVLTDE